MRRFSLPLIAILVAALSVAPARAASGPALWLVQSGKAKVYIFGTVHILKSGTKWTTAAIDDALAKSDDLWLETPDDPSDESSTRIAQLRNLGIDKDHPLSSKLTKADLADVDARVKAMGLPGEASVEQMRPWLIALVLDIGQMTKSGYSAKDGVEATLTKKMKAAGKTVKGLETTSDQIHFFADLTQQQEVAFLHATLASLRQAEKSQMDDLVSAWQNGDVDKVAREDSDFIASDPLLSAVILTDRNSKWAKELDDVLRGSGTSFVAVGMGHLAGPGSLIEDLTKLGYKVTRLE